MRQRTYLFIAPLLLLISFLGFNLGAGRFLSGLTFDATQDRLFTLSPGTKKIIAESDGKIIFDFYYSKHAANENPPLRLYGARVRDILKTYEASSKGKIILREHDVAPFSPAEDNAIAANLIPWRDNLGAVPPIYLGLVISKPNQNSLTIPAFKQEREASLEYDITRLISKLNNPKGRIIGVISDIEWFISSDPSGLRTIPNSQIAKEISAEFEVVMLPRDFDRLPQKMDALFIAQPFDLSEFQQYLIDQYAVNGGRILLAQDVASSISHDNKIGRISSISALGRLSTNWGFSLSGAIVADKQNALLVQTKLNERDAYVPQPLYFSANGNGINRSHLITSNLLLGVNFATPGEIKKEANPNLVFEPLLSTSKETMLLDKQFALNSPTPQEVISLWQGENEGQIIAASIKGLIKSAFPKGAPIAPPRSQLAKQLFGEPSALAAHKYQSQSPANIIIISDVDFLSDGLFYQSEVQTADNANFVLNAIDFLSGDAGLVDLRTREKAVRRLKAIENIEKTSQAAALENQTRIASHLRNLQAQLVENEALGANANQLENAQLRKEIAKTRTELRALEGAKQGQISKLKNLIILICVVLVPMLVLFMGLFVNRRSYHFHLTSINER